MLQANPPNIKNTVFSRLLKDWVPLTSPDVPNNVAEHKHAEMHHSIVQNKIFEHFPTHKSTKLCFLYKMYPNRIPVK